MEDDPYLEMIDEQWDDIVAMYGTFAGKKQIIEYDVTTQKIYSYPADDYIRTLSERTRDNTRSQFMEAASHNQFLLFVKDTKMQRLRSYVLELPESPCKTGHALQCLLPDDPRPTACGT